MGRNAYIKLNNKTDYEMVYETIHEDHGKLNKKPPDKVSEHSAEEFEVGNHTGKAVGPKGWVKYKMAGGEVKVSWDHPFSSDRSVYIASVPKGIQSTLQPSNPKGHTQHVEFTFTRQKPSFTQFKTAVQSVFLWDKKGHEAHEFKRQDANYRVWMPDVSENTGTTTWMLYSKLDHIRGDTGDDHGIVTLRWDSETGEFKGGDLEMAIYKHGSVDAPMDTEALPEGKAKAAAELANAAAALTDWIAKNLDGNNRTAGREIFPSVIEEVSNEYESAVSNLFADPAL